MTGSVRLWLRKIWLVIRGAFCGYVAYLLLLWAEQVFEFGRVDEEKFLYSLPNPILLPYLFWPPNWKELSRYDGGIEVFLILSGATLMISGVAVSIWLGSRVNPDKNAIRSLGL